ncbi:MAG: hypothetical protein WA993_13525 [Candidatus Binatus sp.]
MTTTPLEPICESSRIAPMPPVRRRRAAFDVGRDPAIIGMARSLD